MSRAYLDAPAFRGIYDVKKYFGESIARLDKQASNID